MSEAAVFGSFPALKTTRLVLRQIRGADTEGVYRLFSDPAVTRHYDLATFNDLAQARELVTRFSQRFERRIGLRWGLALKEDPEALVGTCGYNIWIRPARRGLLGYDLIRALWGRGLMTEALSAVLDYGFRAMDLNRVEALTFPANAASRRLLARLGFTEEGLLREYECYGDVPQDLAIYGLLRRDWRDYVDPGH